MTTTFQSPEEPWVKNWTPKYMLPSLQPKEPMRTTIPGVKIELDPPGGPDQRVLLEQERGGSTESVMLHPSHVRLIAERLGMLPLSDPQAQRTIECLSRRLHTLCGRIDRLHGLLRVVSNLGHEDLDYELSYSAASVDIAKEFIADLPWVRDPVAPQQVVAIASPGQQLTLEDVSAEAAVPGVVASGPVSNTVSTIGARADNYAAATQGSAQTNQSIHQ